nr:hypothetical protein [Tanacetum cinerariifolium]
MIKDFYNVAFGEIMTKSRSKRAEGKNLLMKAVRSSSQVSIVPSLSLSNHVFASPVSDKGNIIRRIALFLGTVVPFSGAKERHEKIEWLTTLVVVPFSLAPYITASAVENGTRNRMVHHSSGGAILAPLFFLSFCDLVGYMCTNGTTFSRANGCPTKCGAVRFLVPLSILLTWNHFLGIFENSMSPTARPFPAL